MNITDVLSQTGALDSISRQLGIDPSVAKTGAEALLPAILGGFKKQAQPQANPAGGLGGGLGGLGGGLGSLIEAIGGGGAAAPNTQTGNEVLGEIFGSKDVSRTVAGQASQTTGISPELLKKMLPLLAMAVTAYLSSQGGGQAAGGASSGGGILGQVLGGLFGGGNSGGAQQSGGLGGLGSLIDLDGDGNPLDDILDMASKMGGR